MKLTWHEDGSLILSSQNGQARISRTPPDARVVPLRPWALEINGTLQGTYDTDVAAVTKGKEILARKP